MIFLASGIRAARVNLVMNDFASGLPSPMAFLGLGAAIAPACGADRWSVGVLPILHEVSISEGRTKPEMQAKAGSFEPIEMVEDMTGFVSCSIVFDIPGCSDQDIVRLALLGRRIGGGVFQDDRFGVEIVVADGQCFRRARRGYAMIRPDDEARRIVSRGDVDTLAGIASALYPAERYQGFGWPVPLAVGYHLIEDPGAAKPRRGVRDPSVPHVFVEPVVGIGELVSVRNKSITSVDEHGLGDLFWRWNTEDSWILGHRAYVPKPIFVREEV